METSRAAFLSAVEEIGRRYGALTTNQDKADFRDELDISSHKAQEYCAIAKKAPAKLALIKEEGGQTPAITESFRTWRELVKTSDALLRKAVKAGLFDHEVTSLDLEQFKRRGLVSRKETTATKAIVSQVLTKLERAEHAINTAVGRVSALRSFMDRHDLSLPRGPQVQNLEHTFKLLCAEVAATDPKMLERALKPLRGED
jgi:hypothetical protein